MKFCWFCWCADAVPLSIIFDILKVPAFWKYSTCSVFFSLCLCLQKFFFWKKCIPLSQFLNDFPFLMHTCWNAFDLWVGLGWDGLCWYGNFCAHRFYIAPSVPINTRTKCLRNFFEINTKITIKTKCVRNFFEVPQDREKYFHPKVRTPTLTPRLQNTVIENPVTWIGRKFCHHINMLCLPHYLESLFGIN